jgi:hypothetical protein
VAEKVSAATNKRDAIQDKREFQDKRDMEIPHF